MKKVFLSSIGAFALVEMSFSFQKEELSKVKENFNSENVAHKISNG